MLQQKLKTKTIFVCGGRYANEMEFLPQSGVSVSLFRVRPNVKFIRHFGFRTRDFFVGEDAPSERGNCRCVMVIGVEVPKSP